MKGYKGFEKGLVCLGKQYAENSVFEEPKAVICESGMHFCENPLDVLDYYPLLNGGCELNDFAEVEALDKALTNDGKKFTTTKLKIGAKLDFAGLVKASVGFVQESCKKTNGKDSAKLASSGNFAQLASSGDSAKLASSGNFAQLASSGSSAQLASSGWNAQLASSGNFAQLASSGNFAQLASSGSYAQLASSGWNAQLASSGWNAQLASSGEDSVIAAIGINNIAKAAKGNWITLAEWRDNGKGRYIPACVKTRKVDGKHIKANTWYVLKDGKFTEVE